jgi:hypothetical protein
MYSVTQGQDEPRRRVESSPATTAPMTVQKYAQNLKKLLNATPVDCPRPKAPGIPETLYG